MRLIFLFILSFTAISFHCVAQKDSLKTTPLFKNSNEIQLKGDTSKKVITDTAKIIAKPKHDPKKATFRSAVLPGWGQIYNREYWKLPIVYGALAIPTAVYIFNNNYYKWTKFAYVAVYDSIYFDNDSLLKLINKKVLNSSGHPLELSSYQQARNSYKRNKDYSLLWFILVWGLNVADATVFGHLKDFDVSDDLTMHINPAYNPATKTSGLSFVFNIKNPTHKPLPSF